MGKKWLSLFEAKARATISLRDNQTAGRGPFEAGELQKDSKRKLEVLEEAVTVGLPLPWEQGAFSRVED